jgi:hypothetical protein
MVADLSEWDMMTLVSYNGAKFVGSYAMQFIEFPKGDEVIARPKAAMAIPDTVRIHNNEARR